MAERQTLAREKASRLWQENDLVFAGKHGTEMDAAASAPGDPQAY
ncbi:hypothetical protein [Streptosporangium sp. NPDC049644]